MWTVNNFQYNTFHKEKKVDTQITGTVTVMIVYITYTVDDLSFLIFSGHYEAAE